MILTGCPHCNWQDNVEPDFVGQIAECPSCGEDFKVRDLNAPEPAKKPRIKTKAKLKSRRPASKGTAAANRAKRSRARNKKLDEEPTELPPEPTIMTCLMSGLGIFVWGPILFGILAFVAAIDAENGVNMHYTGRRAGAKNLFAAIGGALGKTGSVVVSLVMLIIGSLIFFAIAKVKINRYQKKFG